MATSKQNRSIKLKIEATLPIPEVQQQNSAKRSCTDCGKCGKEQSSGAKRIDPSTPLRMTNPLLQHAGTILINLISGQYTPEQIKDGFGMLDELLRHHYGRQQ